VTEVGGSAYFMKVFLNFFTHTHMFMHMSSLWGFCGLLFFFSKIVMLSRKLDLHEL